METLVILYKISVQIFGSNPFDWIGGDDRNGIMAPPWPAGRLIQPSKHKETGKTSTAHRLYSALPPTPSSRSETTMASKPTTVKETISKEKKTSMADLA